MNHTGGEDKDRAADVRAKRLQTIISMPEFQEVVEVALEVFEANYLNMMNTPEESEMWEARGGNKSLDLFFNRLGVKLKQGEIARRQLSKLFQQSSAG